MNLIFILPKPSAPERGGGAMPSPQRRLKAAALGLPRPAAPREGLGLSWPGVERRVGLRGQAVPVGWHSPGAGHMEEDVMSLGGQRGGGRRAPAPGTLQGRLTGQGLSFFRTAEFSERRGARWRPRDCHQGFLPLAPPGGPPGLPTSLRPQGAWPSGASSL